MKPAIRLSLISGVTLSLLIGCGGSDDFQEFNPGDIKPADPGAHDHHHHHGEDHKAPHGGTLVALGDHQYHAEIVWDETAKTITVYVLDGEAEKAVPISAGEISLATGTGDKAEKHTFAAQPEEGDGEGKSSRFVSTDKALFETFHDNDSATGQIDLSIDGKSFAVPVVHQEHDHHDHEHDKHDDHKHGEKDEHGKDGKATDK